uniref:Uncharacterized protein n=1 Tax=Arundo donax TaxID=35708 RepID=A0A0A9C7J2_ARUDO
MSVERGQRYRGGYGADWNCGM